MRTIKCLWCITAILFMIVISACAGTTLPSPLESTPSQTTLGDYRLIQQYLPTTLPPVTVGKSLITYAPLLDFPPGSVDIYQKCILDMSRILNVETAS